MTTFTFTEDQQCAKESFVSFMLDPNEMVFVLSGYSGTGKSTLVSHLLEQIPGIIKTAKLIQANYREYTIELTATTNKAAESLSQISGMSVSTIHSFLGLRVNVNHRTGESTLLPTTSVRKEGYLLFVDEASYIDANLLGLIFKCTQNCKIVFIGDPAQLTPIKSSGTPVFEANFPGAKLNQVVRQAEDNPIIDLSTKFRETVNSGQFFSFVPDGEAIQYMCRDDFDNAVESEFTRPDWKYRDSKFLAWTNKKVIAYNHAIQNKVKGNPNFAEGDYAICNNYVSINRKNIKTDQLVCITTISEEMDRYGVKGHWYGMDYSTSFFGANSLAERNARVKEAKANGDYHIVAEIEDSWIDLRAAFAQTVNKSQGSTYDRVFIDLDDIGRCTNGNQIARMLYVGVSRARQQVILTGDLV